MWVEMFHYYCIRASVFSMVPTLCDISGKYTVVDFSVFYYHIMFLIFFYFNLGVKVFHN